MSKEREKKRRNKRRDDRAAVKKKARGFARAMRRFIDALHRITEEWKAERLNKR